MFESFFPPSASSLREIDTGYKGLYETETTIITALISAKPTGGWPREEGVFKVQSIDIAAWQPSGQKLLGQKLLVLRAVPWNLDYFKDYPKLTQQKMEVILSVDHKRAIFVKSFPLNKHSEELSCIAEELAQPVSVATERFGVLKLNRTTAVDEFQGCAPWGKNQIWVDFSSVNDKPDPQEMQVAEQVCDMHEELTKQFERIARSELGEPWDESQPQLSDHEYLSRMELHGLSVNSDGSFTLWFSDGDLFGDHSVCAEGDLVNGLKSVFVMG